MGHQGFVFFGLFAVLGDARDSVSEDGGEASKYVLAQALAAWGGCIRRTPAVGDSADR